jgi:hypothetical protein
MKSFFVLCVVLLATAVHAQTQPVNKNAKVDMQAAFEQEQHVVDAAMVETCSSLFPDLAPKIAANWREALKALSPRLTAYRKTPAYAKLLGDYKRDQALEAKKPEHQALFQSVCNSMAE